VGCGVKFSNFVVQKYAVCLFFIHFICFFATNLTDVKISTILNMKRIILICAMAAMVLPLSAQSLSPAWEELTAPEFKEATRLAEGVCIIPVGVIEKHGPHLPLGTDVFTAREVSLRAAANEYCLVFPFYYVGQIFEAKHQPGTVSYSPELMFSMLEETCRELARNGLKKIIIVSGHGGNGAFLEYFCQTQLSSPRDYTVYVFRPSRDIATTEKIASMRKSTTGGHADEIESSEIAAIRPELAKLQRASDQSGRDLQRNEMQNLYTGIWWYAKYPNHYAGEASGANAAIGEVSLEQRAKQLAGVVGMVKRDKITRQLMEDFWRESASPLETPVYK
jgi:creatinine amidohydrolase